MTVAEELVREVERMKKEGKTTEEIMAYTDEVIWKWNRDTLAQIRLKNMMDGVLA